MNLSRDFLDKINKNLKVVVSDDYANEEYPSEKATKLLDDFFDINNSRAYYLILHICVDDDKF